MGRAQLKEDSEVSSHPASAHALNAHRPFVFALPRWPQTARTAVLVVVLGVLAAWLSAPSPGGAGIIAARPLASVLRADGTLRTTSGSFDARGYRMALGAKGAPRFVRAGAAGAGLGAGVALSALGAGAAQAATGDTLWSDHFGVPGVPQAALINAVAVAGSKIYVGGRFSSLGPDTGIAAADVAMWNGSSWSPLGAGIGAGSVTQAVQALAVVGSHLYAGGTFTSAGGTPVNELAMWNGSTWSDVGGGVSGSGAAVDALAVSGSTLYVGGTFTQAGTTVANSVAAWNATTSTWSTLGSGLQYCFWSGGRCTGTSSSTVNALLYANGTLYAGGLFTAAGGQEVESLAGWDGTAWSAIGGNGLRSGSGIGQVHALAVDTTTTPATLAIGGSFDHVGGTVANGTVSTPGVAASAVAEWNGSSWSALGLGAQSGGTPSVTALAFALGKLFMSGNFNGAGGNGSANVAQWDPATSAWNAVGPGLSNYPRGMIGGSTLLAVGGFAGTADSDSSILNGVGRWTGSAWTGFGLGITGGTGTQSATVYGLATYNHTLYAAGSWGYTGYTKTWDQGMASFDTKAWHSMAAGLGCPTCVNTVAEDGKYIFIGGAFSFTDSYGQTARNIAVWDGAHWHALGSGVGGNVNALLIYRGELWVGGKYTTAGSLAATDIAGWNLAGLTANDYTDDGWAGVGQNPGFDQEFGSVFALAGDSKSSKQHFIIIGGNFQDLTDQLGNGALVNGLVSYELENTDTSSYLSGYGDFPGTGGTVGITTGGSVGTVNAITLVGQKMFVGGSFDTAGAQPSADFAYCDLTQVSAASGCWQPTPGNFLLAGGSASVSAIAPVGSDLYIGGRFDTVAPPGGTAVPVADVVEFTPASGVFAPLGSGISASYSGASVSALAQGSDGLYVGGHFALAGGKSASTVGLWTGTKLPTLTQAASAGPYSAGSPITFTARITNASAMTWSGLSLTETLPSGSTYDSSSISTSGGSCTATTTTPVKLTCSVGTLDAASSGLTPSSATVAITVTPAASGSFKNQVVLRPSGATYDNAATTTVSVG